MGHPAPRRADSIGQPQILRLPSLRSVAQDDKLGERRRVLQRDAALPGDEIVLAKLLGFGQFLAACNFDAQVKEFLGAFGDGGLSGDDAARVEVDDVAHASGECGVGGDLDHGRDGIAGWRAKPRSEEDEICACARLRSHTFHVVPGGAKQSEAGCPDVLGEVEDVTDRRRAAFARRAG